MDKLSITYGISSNTIDITNIVLEKCMKQNVIFIPSDDVLRAQLFTDPVANVHKIITIIINEKESEYTEFVNIFIDTSTFTIYTDNDDIPLYIRNIYPLEILKIIQFYNNSNSNSHCLEYDNYYISKGFIILRHVNSFATNLYWIECYDCIRQYYPNNMIIIIDDNSNYNYITTKELINTKIIQSEFHQRGELLPYYYYSINKWFDTAIILHDSVFIKKYIDFSVEKYKILWNINHDYDQTEDEIKIINSLNNNKVLLEFHKNKSLWTGCFGGMTIITYDYLKFLDNKYSFSNLLNVITSRFNRCSFERVLACILQLDHKPYNYILLGFIATYCRWGIPYSDKNNNNNLPIVKIWTGR